MSGFDILVSISTVAAGLSAGAACFAWMSTRRGILHQALMDIHTDYRSAAMMDAIKSLWDFYRTHGKDKFVEEYEKKRKTDDEKLATLPPKDRVEFIITTLHYKRRFVSYFYFHLAYLYLNKILTKKILYSFLSRGDLEIIHKILLPIEDRLGKEFGTDKPKQLMSKLYLEAPK